MKKLWPENRGVWIMLGNRDDGNNDEGGSEVIGVFNYKPTKKEQKQILKYYIINVFLDRKLSIENLKDEMDGYTINLVQADIQKRG